MDNQIETSENGVEVTTAVMPGYRDLVNESFAKSLTSWPLFLALSGTSVVMAVVSFLLEQETIVGLGVILGLTLVMFATLFANLFMTVVAVKYYLNDGAIELMASFKEVCSNAWSYLWVLLLSSLVMFSGFILFIIPGIILSTYLMFVLHARVAESALGVDSLVRSTDLVRGYWWAVTGRLAVLSLAMIVAFFGVGFMFGILAVIGGLSEEMIGTVSLLAIEPVFGTLGTLIYLYAATVLYKVLVSLKVGTVTESSSARGWYIGLAILAPVLIIVVVTLLAMGVMDKFIDPALQDQIMMEMEASA